MKYSPITLSKSEYKELIKTYSESEPLYDVAFSMGYVRCLYDYDLITRNQWNYLRMIINKYGVHCPRIIPDEGVNPKGGNKCQKMK